VQYIRGSAIIQLLLGNMGRPGGGIMALRGHASIQGSTDIPTLFNILPGYLPMPKAGEHDDVQDYLDAIHQPGQKGFWANADAYAVSLLKAWYGDAATPENGFCFDHLPRLTGDHGTYRTVMDMVDGKVEGYFLVGQNPAVGSAQAKMQRLGLANLKWLVVRDVNLIESATFWKDAPEIATGELRTEDIATEVFFLPARRTPRRPAPSPRRSGWCSGGTRRSTRPVTPARSWTSTTSWAAAARAAGRLDRPQGPGAARPHLGLRGRRARRAQAESVLAEINGTFLTGRRPGSRSTASPTCAPTGRPTAGCWIYSGIYKDGVNQAARASPAGAGLRREPVGLGVADGPPHPLQPRVGRPRGTAVERAQGLRLVGRAGAAVDRPRRARTSR
jgi:formate dehydrogenase major subunit